MLTNLAKTCSKNTILEKITPIKATGKQPFWEEGKKREGNAENNPAINLI